MGKIKGKGKLQAGLRSLEARKVSEAKVKRAEEAAKRKADSITGVSKKKKLQQQQQQNKEQQKPKASSNGNVDASKRRPRGVYPFEREDSILLVGEGDFSYTLSLLSAPHDHSPSQICATSYDSESTCLAKYPTTAPSNIASLRAQGCRLEFNVDAGSAEALLKLTAQRQVGRWSKVVFNFPHVGMGHKDEGRNVLANQALLIRFLVAVAPCLSRGEVPRYATGAGGAGTKARAEREESVSDVEEEGVTDDDLDDVSLLDEKEGREVDEEGAEKKMKKPASPSAANKAPKKLDLVTPSNRAGSVLITLRNCSPYTKWDVGMLAKQLTLVCEATIRSAPALPKGQHAPSPAQLATVRDLAASGKGFRVWRSFAFDKRLYGGYEHRRTLGWKASWQDVTQKGATGKGEEQDELGRQECRTWELGLQ